MIGVGRYSAQMTTTIDRHDRMHSAARTSYRLGTLGLEVPVQCVLGAGVAHSRFFDSGQLLQSVAELLRRGVITCSP